MIEDRAWDIVLNAHERHINIQGITIPIVAAESFAGQYIFAGIILDKDKTILNGLDAVVRASIASDITLHINDKTINCKGVISEVGHGDDFTIIKIISAGANND